VLLRAFFIVCTQFRTKVSAFLIKNHATETRTYLSLTGTQASDGFMGLRIDTRYTGVVQEDGTVLVALIGAPMGTGVTVSSEEWGKWFRQ
jgi:hypothetical protein